MPKRMSDWWQGPGWWQASDGKWYPPAVAPPAMPPVTPPRGNGLMISIVVAGFGVLAAAGVAVVSILAVTLLGQAAPSQSSSGAQLSTTTTARVAPAPTASPGAASVASKPCVAENGPSPAGAPRVPVQVGPPPTTLIIMDLNVGTGAAVTASSTVTVDYVGVACSTGRIFDTSYRNGPPVPASFPLTEVIPGWTDGLPGMKVGGQRLLGIPSDQAYGNVGSAPDIAPGETPWFAIDLVATTP